MTTDALVLLFTAAFAFANGGLVIWLHILNGRMRRHHDQIAHILSESEENIKILEERAAMLQAAEQALAQHCIDAGVERVTIAAAPGTKH